MEKKSTNIVWHEGEVSRDERSRAFGHRGAVVWFTGLSGSGKSTLARAVEKKLFTEGVHCYVLDGDNVRHGLCADLGFSDADREENIRRIGEVAKLMCDAGLVVLTAFISPFRADRARVRSMLQKDEFVEVHVATELGVCEARDPKGLYARARQGNIQNFTGIDSPYEEPEMPEVRVKTESLTADVAAVLNALRVFRVIESDRHA